MESWTMASLPLSDAKDMMTAGARTSGFPQASRESGIAIGK